MGECVSPRELAPRGLEKHIVRALRAWADRRDPSACYHELSKLSPSYYGWPVRVRREPSYYKRYPQAPRVRLPLPPRLSGVDLFEALLLRESRREYSGEPLGLGELAAVLYYSVGVTGRKWWGGPRRPYPSAGALQPVEAYVIAGRVEGLESGVYHYNPGLHELELIARGDRRRDLYRASLEQDHVLSAPATIVLTAVYSRTAEKYDTRAYRYILLDTGFAGQNIYLTCEALGLATVAVGAFHDEEICSIIGIDCGWEYPLLLFPVGKRQG